MSIYYCHKCIENLHFKLKKLLCNFVGLCNFFACARPISKFFGLEAEHLFYVALESFHATIVPRRKEEMKESAGT